MQRVGNGDSPSEPATTPLLRARQAVAQEAGGVLLRTACLRSFWQGPLLLRQASVGSRSRVGRRLSSRAPCHGLESVKRIIGVQMAQPEKPRAPWFKSPFAWTVIGGLAGVIAAVVAIAAYANDVRSNRSDPPTTSKTQAAPMVTTPDSPPPTSRATAPTTPPASTVAGSPDRYLIELEALREPYGDNGPATIDRSTYERSVHTYCGEDSLADPQVWQVEPGYSRFRAFVGIPDSDPNAGGKIAQFSFRDHQGDDLIGSFGVRLGEVREVDIDLRGAVQLHITCVAKDASTGKLAARFKGALGDARFAGES